MLTIITRDPVDRAYHVETADYDGPDAAAWLADREADRMDYREFVAAFHGQVEILVTQDELHAHSIAVDLSTWHELPLIPGADPAVAGPFVSLIYAVGGRVEAVTYSVPRPVDDPAIKDVALSAYLHRSRMRGGSLDFIMLARMTGLPIQRQDLEAILTTHALA